MLIFDFTDHRKYLRTYQRQLPKKGWGFVSKLADAIGVSQVHVSQALSGKKDFSPEQAVLIAEFLRLNETETEYFVWLVLQSRSGHFKLTRIAEAKLAKLKAQGTQVKAHLAPDKELTEEEKARFYSHHIYSAVRHFVTIGKGKSLGEISEKFSLDRPRALAVVEFLVQAGLAELKDGRYTGGARRTFVDRSSPHLSRHHSNWRMKAIADCQEIGTDELVYTSPMSISRKDFQAVHSQLLALIKEVSARVRQTEPELIVCWNMDWFEVKR